MSVSILSESDLVKIREAARISAAALKYGGEQIKAGMTTKQLDKLIHAFIIHQGAKPNFLGYGGFPASACISINDEIIHGIPSKKRVIREGDIVTIDVGAEYEGFNGDNCATFPVGHISDEAKKLLEDTEASLYEGIKAAQPGNRIGDIGHAVEQYLIDTGRHYGIVRDYCGHGIGRDMHESPDIPNYGVSGHGPRLIPGMCICIEPMVNLKGDDVRVLKNGWTVVTASGSLSCHFEKQLEITENGPKIISVCD